MHDCPHCGGTIGIGAWQLARADTYYCGHCSLPLRPSHALRKSALRLVLARRRVEQEFAADAATPEGADSPLEDALPFQNGSVPAE